MIIGAEGFMGDGKTVFIVRCAKIDSDNGRKIYSNIHLYGIEYTPLLIDDFLNVEQADKYHNATLLIDEITLFMDCRRSSKKENIALSTLLRQSRKRDIDIYYTCQDLDEVDLRLIKFTSIFVVAERCFRTDEKGNVFEDENFRNYTIIDTTRRKERSTKLSIDIRNYFDFYDTNEILESIYAKKKN